MVKATVDAVGAAILLVLVSPLLLVLMIGVWIDSPGPAIFRQVRVGKDGRLFEVLKLRTMVSDAEDRKAAPAGRQRVRRRPLQDAGRTPA